MTNLSDKLHGSLEITRYTLNFDVYLCEFHAQPLVESLDKPLVRPMDRQTHGQNGHNICCVCLSVRRTNGLSKLSTWG